jgi:Flp pilus assembly protein CpaB
MAIFSGLLGAYGLRALLLAQNDPKPTPEPPPPLALISVPLAAADLPAGRTIRLADIGLHRMTQKTMQERGLANASVMLSPEQITGRMLRAPLKRGEPFTSDALYLHGDRPNVSDLLKPGQRAVNIQLPNLRGGNLDVGAIVDVLFRTIPQEKGEITIPEATVTLIEGVEIIYADRPTPADRAAARNASNNIDLRFINGREPPNRAPDPVLTLAVTLEQANMLRAVEGRGELSLIPRSAADLTGGAGGKAKLLTLEDLLGIEAPPVPPPPFKTQIFRGTKESTNTFDAVFTSG